MPRRQYLILFLGVTACLSAIAVLTMSPTAYASIFKHIQNQPYSSNALVHGSEIAPLITDLRLPVNTLPKSWVSHNEIAMHALFRCLETSSCGQNQTKVVLLGWDAFLNEIEESHEGGEVIWSRSTVRALKKLGYTYLYSPNNERTLQLYHVFRGLITAIFIEERETNACFNDPKCVLSSSNPSGIPVWKMFSCNWWTGAVGPLKNNWTLNPEDYRLEGKGYAPNMYLGYSVEPACSSRPFVPHSERKRQAYVLAKEMHYFEPDFRAWEPDFFDAAHEVSIIEFVSGVRGAATADFPLLGYMSPSDFYDELSRSLVLVGVGLPFASPTPYDALCFGVPFINPITEWDAAEPLNRDKWSVQHGMMKHLHPPYVYHVYKGDRNGFVNAIKEAVAHPIESFVLDRMKMKAVKERLGRILSKDWEAEFSLVVIGVLVEILWVQFEVEFQDAFDVLKMDA
ncbi:hypothetical protein MVEN_00762300 [Mycena venus]|uniref:Glycosyltransferase family 18 catalytic domain-containing protein n=1 Tax=Mycena venus TaxID=2733690 RepID=A0A8H7D682_9AGAR|nr:hypothetical protein MVEN_00762300 [Mycena venus]